MARAQDVRKFEKRIGKTLVRGRLRDKPEARSLLTQGIQALNWWNRVAFSYMKTAEDINEPIFAPTLLQATLQQAKILGRLRTDKEAQSLFAQAYDSEDAREFRFHNLDTFEPAGRAIYTANTIGQAIFKAAAKPGQTPEDFAQETTAQTIRLLGDRTFRNAGVLSHIRSVYNSPEAKEWIEKNGPIFVDLPVGLAVDMSNPIFAAVGAAPKILSRVRYDRFMAGLGRRPTLQRVRAALISELEGAPYSDEVVGLVHSLLSKARGEEARQVLTASGYRPRGLFSDLRDNLPRFFRAAGNTTSPLGRKAMLARKQTVAKLDEQYQAGIMLREELAGKVAKLSSDETLQLGALLERPADMARLADTIEAGRQVPVSQGVVDAFQTHRKVVDLDFVQRLDNWPDQVASRLNKIDEVLASHFKGKSPLASGAVQRVVLRPGEVKGVAGRTFESFEFTGRDILINKKTGEILDLPPRVREQVLRQLRDAPPYMQWYYRKVINEAVRDPSIVTNLQTRRRLRFFEQPREGQKIRTPEQINAEAQELFEGPKEWKQVYLDVVNSIGKRAFSTGTQASADEFLAAVDRGAQQIRAIPVEQFGNRERKLKAIQQMRELRDGAQTVQRMAASSDSKVRDLGDRLLRSYDVGLRAFKQGWLFFTPSFYLQNFTDNNIKNVIAMGPKEWARWKTNLNAVNGTQLNFTRGFQGLAGKPLGTINVPGIGPVRGLLDLPGFKALDRGVVNPTVDATEGLTRNKLGSFSYWETVKQLKQKGLQNVEEMHQLALSRAEKMVSRVQFFNDEMSAAAIWLDRFVPFSTTFTLPNLKFWGETFMANPRAGTTLLRLREDLKDMSVDGSGRVGLPGSKIRFDPISWSSVNNAIRVVEGTIPFEEQDTPTQNVIRALRIMDSAAGAIAPRGLFPFRLASTLKDLPTLAVPGGVAGVQVRREQENALFGSANLLAPLDTAARILVGLPLDKAALRLAGFPEAQFERSVEWNRNLEIKAADLSGQRLSRTEGLERAMGNWRVGAMFRFFGMNAVVDEEENKGRLMKLRDEYLTTSDAATRQAIWDNNRDLSGKPLLRGLVGRVPYTHAQAEVLERFDAETNPAKIRAMYQDLADSARGGLLENIFDKVRTAFSEENVLKLKSAIDREIGEFGLRDAAAGETSLAESVGYTVLRDFDPSASEEVFNAQRDKITILPEGETQFYKEVPLYQPDGTFQFLEDWAMGFGPVSAFIGDELKQKNRRLNSQLNAAFNSMQLHFDRIVETSGGTAEDLERVRDGDFSLSDGTRFKNYNAFFFKDVEGDRTRITAMMQQAFELGAVDPRKVVEPGVSGRRRLPLSSANRRFYTWLQTSETPGIMASRIGAERRGRDAVLRRGLQVMERSNRGPRNFPHATAALEIDQMVEDRALPSDFFKRVMESEDFRKIQTMQRFAVQLKSRNLAFDAGFIYDQAEDGSMEFNPQAVLMLAATGRLTEMKLLAASDRNVQKTLQTRGLYNGVQDSYNEALEDYLEGNEVEVTDVMRDTGYLPAEGAIEVGPDGVTTVPPVPQIPEGQRLPTDVVAAVDINSQKIRSLALPPGRSNYRNTTEFIQEVISDTARANRAIDRLNVQIRAPRRGAAAVERSPSGEALRAAIDPAVSAPELIPRRNIFEVAARRFPRLPPDRMALGAAQIMRLGNRAGLIGNDELRTIFSGINQVSLMQGSQQILTNVMDVAAAALTGVSLTQRASRFAIRNPKGAKLAARAGAVGTALTLGAGVAAAEGQEELAAGLGVGGGVISGVAIGLIGGPIGAVIGGVIGGTLGAFGAGLFGGAPEPRPELRRERAALISERRGLIEVQRREAEARRITRTQRALTQRVFERGPRRDFDRLQRFFVRPTFRSATGGVERVERRAARQFVPRF